MDICRITRKEEFLAAFAAGTRAEQEALVAEAGRDPPVPAPAAAVLAVALPAVCIAVLPRGAYLWVAATLLFELAYPVLLFLPALRRRRSAAANHPYLRTLRALGLLEPGRKLGYLLGNAFVINARAVAPALAWFAAVNLLVALGWLAGAMPARGLGLVIAVQSVLALGAGLAVWRMTPGVGRLRERAAAVHARFTAHRAVGWTVLVLLSVPVALVAVVLLSLLVLPGPPVIRVLAEGRVSPLVQTLEFVVLLAGLYAVTRTVHSRESRHLVRGVAEAIIRYIDGELGPRLEGAPAVLDCEDYRELATGLLEARVYRFERSTVAGRLPVYTISPDLSLVADPETLSALRGHLDLGPAE
jgi:hypothetical protein